MPIDYSKYPPNWKNEIRPRILERAENKCEFCGLLDGQIVWGVKVYCRVKGRYSFRSIWFSNQSDTFRTEGAFSPAKKIKVVLTIAHLDHDEENWDVKDDRLSALCQHCHLNYDSKEKYRRITGIK